MPASESEAIRKVQKVRGMHLRRPPIQKMSLARSVPCRTAHGVNDGAGAEEEQGLEEGVGVEVEDPGGVSPRTQRHHHVTQLADRGVGQDPLEVPSWVRAMVAAKIAVILPIVAITAIVIGEAVGRRAGRRATR